MTSIYQTYHRLRWRERQHTNDHLFLISMAPQPKKGVPRVPKTFADWMQCEASGSYRASLTLRPSQYDKFIQHISELPMRSDWNSRTLRIYDTHPEHGEVCLVIVYHCDRKHWVFAFFAMGTKARWRELSHIHKAQPFMAVAAAVAALINKGELG